MKTSQNEHGRSMVEILGVLAIIGVLSIGGIQGYTYAMNKYKVNQTLNDINLRAVDLMTQESQNKPLSLDEWNNVQTIYPIELVFDADDNAVLQVSNTPQNVCKLLVQDMFFRSEITINNQQLTSLNDNLCNETNVLTFSPQTYEKCGDTYCTNQAPYCDTQTNTCHTCTTSAHCPAEEPLCNKNYQCEACPSNKPYFDSTTNTCAECVTDNDCTTTQLCLKNVCKSFSYSTVFTAEESPDNREWLIISMPGNGYYHNGIRICQKLHKEMPIPDDFLKPGWWAGGHVPKSDFGIAFQNKDKKRHLWVQGYNAETNKALLINMELNDTHAHIYYHNPNSSLQLYCRDAM